MNFRTSNLFLI